MILALFIYIFGIAFFTTLQSTLTTSFDTTLQMRSQQVAEGVNDVGGKVMIGDIVGELPELEATAALIDSFDENDDHKTTIVQGSREANRQDMKLPISSTNNPVLVHILDLHGHTLYATPSFNTLTVPQASIVEPLQGKPWHGTIPGPHGTQFRLYSTMLVDRNTIFGVVQVGQALTELNASLQHIALALFGVTLLALLLSACGCYYLSKRAFKPIHRLATTAREINAKELHQRVPVPGARDEVHDLALIFNQMIGRLEHAFTQQRRFVADASHELRTPVAVIRSVTELALAHPSSLEDYVSVLGEVNAETERLSRLVSDLLALARADEGQVQFDHDQVQLDLLAADVVESLESLATEHGVQLRILKLTPASVLGDAARLIQAIITLVDNALTYTSRGGHVWLSVEIYQNKVFLSVRDTGIGISQKDLPHIFERFYRADPARSRAAGGCGLGLAIAEWIVKAHDGMITVESEVGRGSVFTIILPLAS